MSKELKPCEECGEVIIKRVFNTYLVECRCGFYDSWNKPIKSWGTRITDPITDNTLIDNALEEIKIIKEMVITENTMEHGTIRYSAEEVMLWIDNIKYILKGSVKDG